MRIIDLATANFYTNDFDFFTQSGHSQEECGNKQLQEVPSKKRKENPLLPRTNTDHSGIPGSLVWFCLSALAFNS